MKLRERAERLKTDIPAVFLCMKDSRTPFIAKISACIAVAYALSPVDLIPDFIPVIGWLDDLVILPLLVALSVRFIPAQVFEQNRAKAASLWKDGKPAKWYYAIPVLLVWALIAFLIIKACVR